MTQPRWICESVIKQLKFSILNFHFVIIDLFELIILCCYSFFVHWMNADVVEFD